MLELKLPSLLRRRGIRVQMMGSTFKIVSLNVGGLVNVEKRRRISKYLIKERAGIVCLQETHLHELRMVF